MFNNFTNYKIIRIFHNRPVRLSLQYLSFLHKINSKNILFNFMGLSSIYENTLNLILFCKLFF